MVVIGTSAGGIRALEELVMQLKAEMDAAFFVVLHLSRKGVSDVLFQRLQQHCELPCKVAVNDEPIKKGTVYLAPPDNHLLIDKGKVLLDFHGFDLSQNDWRSISQCILNFSDGICKLHHLTDRVFAGVCKDFRLIGYVLCMLTFASKIAIHCHFHAFHFDITFCGFTVNIIAVTGRQCQEQ